MSDNPDNELIYSPDQLKRFFSSKPPADTPVEGAIPDKPKEEPDIVYSPGDIRRMARPKDYDPETSTTSGYSSMLPAIVKRTIAESVGGPIDFFNWANRKTRESIGETNLPPPKPSAAKALEDQPFLNAFLGKGYVPSDSLEKSIYDAGTAGLSTLVPFGLGKAGMALGAGARAINAPRIGKALTSGGELLTYGGPGTAVVTGAGSELLGDLAATNAPEGQEENARTIGNLGGGLVIGGALSGAKGAYNAVTASMRNPERIAGKTLVDELGRSAATTLAGRPSPPSMFDMTPTAEEVIPGNTGIASLDAYARSTPSGKAIFDQHTANRNAQRLGNVNLGTDVSGGVEDPALALATTHSRLSNPSPAEAALQSQAQAAAGALPTTSAADAETNIGAHINRLYNDSLNAQIQKAADVSGLITGLETKGRPGALALDFKNAVEKKDPITRMGTGEFDEAGYVKWIDENKDKLSPAQFDRLKDIRVAKEELNKITAQTTELAKQFPVTPGGSNAGLASKYFGSDDKGAGAKGAAQYKKLTGGGDAEMGDLFDFGMAKFRGAPGALNADGSYNAAALSGFLASHKGWLDEMPVALRNKLTTARDTQQLFDQTASVRTQALKDFENSAAQHLLPMRDPMERMNDLLNKGNPVANIREVMGQLSSHPEAQNGLRRNFIDFGANGVGREKGFVNTAADGAQTFVPEKFQQFFSQNEDVIKQLYGTPGYNLLKKVNDDITSQLASQARVARATAGVPERLAEGKVGQAFEKATNFISQKIGFLPNVGATLGYYYFAGGEPFGTAALTAIQGGSGINNLLKSAQRRGVTNVTDRMAELLNNPKAAALAMNKAPDDPSHPFLRRLASTLGSATYGVESEKASEHKLDETPGRVGMGPSGVIPGERLR